MRNNLGNGGDHGLGAWIEFLNVGLQGGMPWQETLAAPAAAFSAPEHYWTESIAAFHAPDRFVMAAASGPDAVLSQLGSFSFTPASSMFDAVGPADFHGFFDVITTSYWHDADGPGGPTRDVTHHLGASALPVIADLFGFS